MRVYAFLLVTHTYKHCCLEKGLSKVHWCHIVVPLHMSKTTVTEPQTKREVIIIPLDTLSLCSASFWATTSSTATVIQVKRDFFCATSSLVGGGEVAARCVDSLLGSSCARGFFLCSGNGSCSLISMIRSFRAGMWW